MYEIRVYYQFGNMNEEYYLGDKGIRRRWKAKTPGELLRKWKLHLAVYEGETYSVWEDDNPIVGGAYDPDDDLIIKEYFGIEGKTNEEREYCKSRGWRYLFHGCNYGNIREQSKAQGFNRGRNYVPVGLCRRSYCRRYGG